MREAYALALNEIAGSLTPDSAVLDCGANTGRIFDELSQRYTLQSAQYHGIEWDASAAAQARARGLQVTCGDLNRNLDYSGAQFSCVFGLSVLEHLLNGCRYLRECHRILRPDGTLVLLTPNISTYFTAALILAGKMPSSGPHPDSDVLIRREEVFKVSSDTLHMDSERDTPQHRHLVVFSYRVLRDYLALIGFREVKGYGFGLYPFPNLAQPLLERLDPYHCHQMVFIARK
ncbi:MAG: class SAM-dependent methyltransferase [Nevskia sp.]|nr:class SAM-dependent methyltransferase [Nevskia sp.]